MKPLVALSVLMLLSACDVFESPTAPDQNRAKLSGRVTQAASGVSYYPATVALLESTNEFSYESVNVEGYYRFSDVVPGRYVAVLTVGERAGAREKLREPIVILPGENVKDFVLP
ncbi:MAG TPA: carboxypeptidase-like regulatory domain-containing protein [Thermoanaerobaculia bacterium]